MPFPLAALSFSRSSLRQGQRVTRQPLIQSEPAYEEVPGATFPLVIGTRGSALALRQAEYAAEALRVVSGGRPVHVQIVTSEGDLDKSSPLTLIGGRGVFTSSLQRALSSRQIDAAIHSAKDVPSLSARGLVLAAFPQREDARDVVVSRHGVGLLELPPNPVVGTSSRRRAVQVLALRPDARVVDLRGNIDTRLNKALSNEYDAIILAAAGLTRMGWLDRSTTLLPVDQFTPAPGQGVLAIETRVAPDDTYAVAKKVDQPGIRMEIEVERAFLRGVGGGCITPLGAYAAIETIHGLARVKFHGMLTRDDGTGLTRIYEEWPAELARDRAFAAAQSLLRDVHPNRVFGASGDRQRQLKGMKVVVTGSDHLVERAAIAVRDRGGEPVVMPTIRIDAPLDPRPLHDALDGLRHGRFDRVVLTSQNAVRALSDLWADPVPEPMWVAVVGEATAQALRSFGREPQLIAPESGAEGLLDALANVVELGDRVLLPVSDRGRTLLADGLARIGAKVTVVTAYVTHLISEIDSELEQSMAGGEIGAVLLASPSAVEGFVSQAGHLLPALSGASFVAIGKTTGDAMLAAGLPVHAMPAKPAGDTMVESLASYLWGSAVQRGDDGSGA